MKKIGTKEFSKQGHDARWKSKYQLLVELSGYMDKQLQNLILSWRPKITERQLKGLLEYYKNALSK